MTAAEIKELRTRLTWSQEKLARELDVSWSTVNNWESGKYHPDFRSEQNLAKLAKKHKELK